jgi:hypothetical protein
MPVESARPGNLGLGGRRVLVSREWSGKTLSEHKADRATVVREALLSAGMVGPDLERMAADVRASDGLPRYVWTESRPDPASYSQVILASIAERQRRRTNTGRLWILFRQPARRITVTIKFATL